MTKGARPTFKRLARVFRLAYDSPVPIRNFIFVALLALGSFPAFAQKPRPKAPGTVDVPVKDPVQQAAAIFEAAQNAHQTGDLEKAVTLYSEALSRDPSLWQAEFQRGIAYFSLNRLEDARASMHRVETQLSGAEASTDLKPYKARVQLVLGEIEASAGNAQEAQKAFRRALEIDPSSKRAHAGLAELLLQGNKPEEAALEAQAAIDAGDDRVEARLLLAEAQVLARQFDAALPTLNEIIKAQPSNGLALRYRAQILFARKDYKGAISDLRAAFAAEPKVETGLELARVCGQAHDDAGAAAAYQEVLKLDPANAEARAGVAAALASGGSVDEAAAHLEELLKAEPKRASLHAQLAEIYLPTQPAKSLEHYEAAATLEPAKVEYQVGRASALVKLRRFPDAISALTAVIEKNPAGETLYVAHANLATAYFETQDYQNAATEYIWLLGQQKDKKRAAITLYFLGICFDRLGDYQQAKKAYEQFLGLASAENQLEIDKVKLRLPSLERQLREGKGKSRER
jgi:tetratricopeptide (TPR) repeat protein